jgi:ATP-dependent helicase HrpA
MEYELRKNAGRRHRLLEVGGEVAQVAAQVLDEYHSVALLLSRPSIPAFAEAIKDVREQIAHLLPKGFLTTTPDEWLIHLPRFLKGIATRLGKLSTAGHSRDADRMAELLPFWQAYLAASQAHRQRGFVDPELQRFRWMIEEFRISLFAQELKTSIPISAKRLEKQWEAVRK